jgi:hypothetical protein
MSPNYSQKESFMYTKKMVVTAAAFCFASSPAVAVVCQGVVLNADIQADGLVVVNFGYGHNSVCYLNSNLTVNRGPAYGAVTITPTTCQALYSMFLTSKTTGKYISPHFDRPDCNIGNWVIPNPYPYYWMFNG